MNNMDVILEQAALIRKGQAHALVTILHADGSTPRNSGKLLVLPDGGLIGSIGGGAVELMAVQDARECLRLGKNTIREYSLKGRNSNTGMVCGGEMTVFIESYPARPLLVMCGGGHVGHAVLELAATLGYNTILFDHRADEVSGSASLAGRYIRISDYRRDMAGAGLPEGAYYVIATPGHAQDKEALAAALQLGGTYVGMIGSRKKTAVLFESLAAEGVSREELSSVHAPIGLDIGGETPEEIALAIMAEIQSVRYGRSGKNLCRKG